MKTNVRLKVTHDNIVEYCRVKLDSKKFPYIVINDDKFIVATKKFPLSCDLMHNQLYIEMMEGQDELEKLCRQGTLSSKGSHQKES